MKPPKVEHDRSIGLGPDAARLAGTRLVFPRLSGRVEHQTEANPNAVGFVSVPDQIALADLLPRRCGAAVRPGVQARRTRTFR